MSSDFLRIPEIGNPEEAGRLFRKQVKHASYDYERGQGRKYLGNS